MSDQAKLHRYQCPICRTVLTTPVRARMGAGYQCDACRAYMRYLWAEPLETAAVKALYAQGLVYHHPTDSEPAAPVYKRPCTTCGRRMTPGSEIDLSAAGQFCSDACATKGVEEHEALMSRVSDLKERMPWLT